MSSAPSMYPCPHCGTAASAKSGCPGCGRGPDADALEVMRLDGELADMNQQLDAAMATVTTLQRRITDTTVQRNAVAFRVTSAVASEKSRETAKNRTSDASAVPTVSAAGSAGTAPAGAVGRTTPEPRLTTLTVQNVLFILGGLLLMVAAAVFTAVAWAQVGVTGRAAILAAATAAVLAVPPFAVRRGLTAAAETLAAVGLLMILLDGYAAWAVDFLGVRDHDPLRYASAVCAITAVTAFAYARLTKLRGPTISALLVAQPILPLLALSAEATLTGWSVTLSGVTALNLAVVHRRRYSPTGIGMVAYLCAYAAGIVAALIAIAALAAAESGTAAAAAGGALVLVTALATAAATLSGHREAQTITAGLLTLAVAVAAGGWSLWVPDGTPTSIAEGTVVLRLSIVAFLVAAVVAGIGRLLPDAVARGPRAAGLLVAAVPGLGVTGAAVRAAADSAEAALPLLAAPLDRAVSGPGRETLVAAVAVLCAYAIVPPARLRTDLALTALAAMALLAPPAFGLPWWTAPIVDLAVATGALALAASRTRPPALRLTVAALLTGHALVVSRGDAGVSAAACAVVALVGAATAYRVRSNPLRSGLGAWSATVSLLAVPPAVWLTLLAAGTPVTWQVRAELAVATVFVAAVLVTAVRGVRWYRPQILGVTLLLTAVLPVIAHAGSDAPSLYAAASLLLIAAAVPDRPALTPGAAAAGDGAVAGAVLAAVLPVLALLYATGPDLAVVFVEQYRALGSFWSGTAPATPVTTWTSVIALLITAGAAGLAAYRRASGPAAHRRTPTAGPAAYRRTPASRLWAAAGAAAPVIAIVLPLAVAASAGPWPSVPLAGLVTGLAGLVALAIRPSPATLLNAQPASPPVVTVSAGHEGAPISTGHGAEPISTGHGAEPASTGHGAEPAATGHGGAFVSAGHGGAFVSAGHAAALVFAALGLAGLAGTTPVAGAMLAAFALVTVAAAAIGAGGRDELVRVAGWICGTTSVVVVAYTASEIAGLDAGGAALSVLAAAAVAALCEAVLAARRPREAPAAAAVAHASALVALLIAGTPGRAALIATLWSVVLGLRALRPGNRFGHLLAAGGTVLLGWWLFLASRDVGVVEVYTLPAAVLALGAGWLARRRRPELPSWTAYGPALAAGFLPTLALIGGDGTQYPRRLLLGIAAVAVVLVGARFRLQAPVVTGGVMLVLTALHEVVQIWDLLPRWVPLAVGGLLLVGIATTMEQRRRDVARVRDAVGRLG
ncbi:hypothetical protein AB0F72_31655 [Actinoplanes sp. NPDC023936]|uniref:SCO7613 C-terminal domain-containing membrane protein n=1 Tax=Actinoplanes sp. NPDC023936 TaxID=3154910 RepID=UPI0033CA468C